MTRPFPLIALAMLLSLPVMPGWAAPAAGAAAEAPRRTPLVLAPEQHGAPLVLAQYYGPPPRYRRPHRRCWTTTQRVIQYDRWGRAHVRYVPRRVCGYR